MTIDAHTASGTLSPIGVVLDINSVAATLDEGWSPYCQVTVVAAAPDEETRALIDLRETRIYLDLRLRQDFGQPWTLADITADITGSVAAFTALLAGRPLSKLTNRYYRPWNGSSVRAASTRSMHLLVTERVFDEKTNEMTLTATSLESLLLGDALVSTSPLDPATLSVRAIVQSVLNRYGEVLAEESLDAMVSVAEATVWPPGVGAWAYLDPMLEAASLRLWCDELGTFTITERQPTTPGAIAITPTGTMTGLRDTMTFDPDVWFDAVVVEYRWVDDFDLNNVAYDVAGPQPARAVLRELRPLTRYPGPGAAAGILNRGQGRGRVLAVDAVSSYGATPGIAATITPLEAEAQTGYVSAVTWRIPQGEMSVATRGLVDTPDTSWLFVEPGTSWLDIPIGTSWLEYEGV